MQMLILGGTGQLGRHLAAAAVAAGHRVTCLARGTRPVPPGARLVRADRDRPGALDEVYDQRWDAVVDLSTLPGRVRRAVAELAAGQWIYVSSVSVYRDNDRPGRREDTPTFAPLEQDQPTGPEDYGAAKAACERAVLAGQGTATIIRPGLIGGAEDDTGRSGYYPWRFAHPTGADVLVPDDPGFPVSLIDGKDLAAWLVLCAEQRVTGVFNATGPTTSLAEAVRASRRVAGHATGASTGHRRARAVVPPRPVPERFLRDHGVSPWMGPDSLPWWIPDPAWRFASTADSSTAAASGLAFRPLERTLAAALAFGPVGAGLADGTERRLRDALAAA
jgi:2'-hydroxyisoflavone reductase